MKGFLVLYIIVIFFYLFDISLWFFLLAPILAIIVTLLINKIIKNNFED